RIEPAPPPETCRGMARAPGSERRLGIQTPGADRARVMLDVVERYWRGRIRPALAVDASAFEPSERDPFVRHASAIRAELAGAVDAGGEQWARYWACAEHGWLDGRPPEPASDEERVAADCAALAGRVEPRAIEVVARLIERHELQH